MVILFFIDEGNYSLLCNLVYRIEAQILADEIINAHLK